MTTFGAVAYSTRQQGDSLMTTRTHKHAASRISSLSTRLRKLVLCAGLIDTLLQPSNLFAQAWSLLNLGDASGTWNTAGNWMPATVPNATDAIADYSTQDITVDSTITLNLAATVNRLVFGDTDTSSSAVWKLSPATTEKLTLGGTTPVIQVNDLGATGFVNMNVIMAGTNGLIKDGPGILGLSKTNAFTGGTTISNGTLRLQANNLLNSNLTIQSPGVFSLNGFVNNSNSPGINALNGDGVIENTGSTTSKNIAIGNSGGGGTFTGVIRGPISITKNGGGNIALTGPNTFDGTFRGQGGKITFNSVGNVGAPEPTALGSPTTIANGYIFIGSGGVSGGTFTYTGTGHSTDRQVSLQTTGGNCTFEASGAGALIFKTDFLSSGGGARTLLLGGTSTSTNEIAGSIPDSSSNNVTRLMVAFAAGASTITLSSVFGIESGASISGTGIATGTTVTNINTSTKVVMLSQVTTGAGAKDIAITVAGVINQTFLTKNGAGTWVLSGPNTYTGLTALNDGTLIVNGTLAADSAVTVAASKTLGGRGTIYGVTSLATGAILKPGHNDIGTLTFANTGTSALTLNKNTLHFDLPNVTGPVDKIAISGGLVLNGTNKIVLAYTGNPRSGTHTIMTYASKTTDSTGTFVFDQEYHPTPTLTIGETSVTVTIPGEGTVLSFK